MLRRERYCQRLGKRPHGLLHGTTHDRHVDVQPLRSARLHEGTHAERVERLPQDQRCVPDLPEGCPLARSTLHLDVAVCVHDVGVVSCSARHRVVAKTPIERVVTHTAVQRIGAPVSA